MNMMNLGYFRLLLDREVLVTAVAAIATFSPVLTL